MASQNHNIFNTLRIQKEGIYHNLINSDSIKTNFVKVYNYKDLSLHSVRKSCSRNEKVSKEIIAQGGNYSSKCCVEMNLYSAGWTLTPTGLSVCDTGHPHRLLWSCCSCTNKLYKFENISSWRFTIISVSVAAVSAKVSNSNKGIKVY